MTLCSEKQKKRQQIHRADSDIKTWAERRWLADAWLQHKLSQVICFKDVVWCESAQSDSTTVFFVRFKATELTSHISQNWDIDQS